MARPIVTFELSDDENSVFVYGREHDLLACVGLQREDAVYELQQYLGVEFEHYAQVKQVEA